MHLESGGHFAATSSMAELTADTAAVKIGAGATEVARGISSPGKTELLTVGGKHRVLTFGTGCEFHCRFA